MVLVSREPYLRLVTRMDDTRKRQSGSSQYNPRKTLRHPPGATTSTSARQEPQNEVPHPKPCRVTLSVGTRRLMSDLAGQFVSGQRPQAVWFCVTGS